MNRERADEINGWTDGQIGVGKCASLWRMDGWVDEFHPALACITALVDF